MLLVGAGLLIRSFVKVVSVDPGFDTGGALVASMSVPATKYPDAPRSALFYSALMERLRRLPGVAAAGAVTQAPFSGADHNGAFEIEGQPAAQDAKAVRVRRLSRRDAGTTWRRSASRCSTGAR